MFIKMLKVVGLHKFGVKPAFIEFPEFRLIWEANKAYNKWQAHIIYHFWLFYDVANKMCLFFNEGWIA